MWLGQKIINGEIKRSFVNAFCDNLYDSFLHQRLYSLNTLFLDAFSHLYKRMCLSVRPSVRRSVGPSVRWSVGHTRVEFLRNGRNRTKKNQEQESMPFRRRFKDKYAGSTPENASVVRTLFDLFSKTVVNFLLE